MLVMVLSSAKHPLMHCTALLLTEPTSPNRQDLLCVNLISQRDTDPQGCSLLPGVHRGLMIKLRWHSVSDGQTRGLGPGEERGLLAEVSQ